MKYYREIDGLRAVSVILVLLYHFGYRWIPGGFVGVDVFFVISGFLITKQLVEHHEKGKIGIGDFYSRRLRRLGPALLTMVALCVAAGYLMLSPGDYKLLSLSALSTLFASSNIYFLYTTGYFDVSAHSLPLLHTWSLAVEEQFYVVWPLTLWLLRRTTRANAHTPLLATTALLVASFGLNVYATGTQEMSAFYLAHNRAWELLVGAIIALWKLNRRHQLPRLLSEMLPLIGLFTIGYAAAEIIKSSSYPGVQATLPVIGAALFLLPVGQSTFVYSLLSRRIPSTIGRASYSLYLYHWPILVFWLHYTSFAPMTDPQRLLLISLSLVAALLSWRYVEIPFRRGMSDALFGGAFLASATAVATTCLVVAALNGIPQRIPKAAYAMSSYEGMWTYDGCAKKPTTMECETGRPWNEAKYRIALIGDSNAVHFVPFLTAAAAGHDISIGLIQGCSPVIDGTRTIYYGDTDPQYNARCRRKRARMLSALHSNPKPSVVVLASAWWAAAEHLIPNWTDLRLREESYGNFKRGLDDLLNDLSSLETPVFLISAVPAWNTNPVPCEISKATSLLRRSCTMNTDRFSMDYFNANQKQIGELLRRFDGINGVVVNSPEDHVCAGGSCVRMADAGFVRHAPYETSEIMDPFDSGQGVRYFDNHQHSILE